MQIRTKLAIVFSAIVTILVGVFFLLIYISSSVYREDEYKERLKAKVFSVVDIGIQNQYLDSAMLKVYARNQRDNLVNEHLMIFDEHSHPLYVLKNPGLIDFSPSFFSLIRTNKEGFVSNAKYEMYGIMTRESGRNVFVVCAAWDRWGYSKLQNLRNNILFLYLGTITVVIVAGYLFSGRMLAPINQVIDQVNNITADQIERRIVNQNPSDEIGRMIFTFNMMLDRIEESFKLQRIFIASASHELQNPLAAITSQIEVALIRKRSTEEYQEVLQSLHEDILELNNITTQLLQLTRLNRNDNLIDFTALRIDELFWTTIEGYKQKYPNHTIDISIDALPEDENKLMVMGNEALIKTAFFNLLDNACKFSSNHGVFAELSARESVTICFKNHGVTFKPEEKDFIFAPFYRGRLITGARGHGIGLSLVQKICEIHNIRIFMETPDESYTQVRLTFPESNKSRSDIV
ncbi:MAG: ATP-binding protein [Bacteroidota bacterium]|jgi:signal transduction histidine kinase